MSFDYDRLRELADEHTPGPWEQATRGKIGNRELRTIVALVGGDESGEQIGDSNLEADRELIALAPDMARELLRLHRELTDLRDLMWKHSGYLKADGLRTAGDWAEGHADRLARILEGDTE